MKSTLNLTQIPAFFLCVLLTSPLFGQQSFNKEEFNSRRERMFEKLGDGIGLVWGNMHQVAPIKFRQSPDLYYLSAT